MRYNTGRVEKPWLQLVVVVVLLVNIIVIGRSFSFYRLPGERGAATQARVGAELVIDHIGRLAATQGLGTNQAVQDSIARLQLDVRKARSVDEVSHALQKGILETQTIMAREEDSMRRDAILSVLGNAPSVQSYRSKTSVVISRDEGNELRVQDSQKLLEQAVISELGRHPALTQAFSALSVEIDQGQVRLPTQRTLADRVTSLEQELATLRVEHQTFRTQSGYLPLTGAGLRIKLYDAFGGYTEDQIVHDSDVRDIVNELASAGATGIAIGDQRLIATSPVRCAGPVILVNFRPIPVNPVTIEAVGDINVLVSSLQLVKTSLMVTKGVKLEIERVENLTLPAYTALR